jgi:hypothetical protein
MEVLDIERIDCCLSALNVIEDGVNSSQGEHFMTPDKIWVRDGVIAEYSNVAPPKFDVKVEGGLIRPSARYNRSDIQQQSIRGAEIPLNPLPSGLQISLCLFLLK